jgi:hypothetical protein
MQMQDSVVRDYTQDIGEREHLPAHEQLNAFVGRWRAEGTVGHREQRKEATAEFEFEWLPGQFFLQLRGALLSPGTALLSTALYGYDVPSGSFRLHQFDNLGYARVYEGVARANLWRFTGAFERVTYTFAPSGDELHIHREQRKSDQWWITLCDLRARREH